ncbi:unnamed protein product [Mytilus coruscus]|uniref:Reverse transcriptase domain-containing protein n=1 Tax=Mytilus coruscus TaxID=42192 RepID=A0A6J8B051_MYTCO|nr:unnamed protein product [Mytilus coruscus]
MPTYGRIEEFKFENNFEEYTERLEEYFLANEIDDDDKKRSIFLTVCGEKTYSLLRNLCAPAKPNTKTFDNLKEVLTDHLRPKPLIIAERYKFHQRKQESHEKLRKIRNQPEENSGWEVFTVKTCRTSDNKELKLDVKIEDVDYVMELDTGAAVSIIGEENYKKYFSNIKLQKSNVKLNTYTGDPITAYQQLLLCENSRNLVTINTHLGLYRYTRLPFGAASSPAIFQEFMDKVLEGLDGVGCILDDLIITGKSDEEHLKNLELVLKRLK